MDSSTSSSRSARAFKSVCFAAPLTRFTPPGAANAALSEASPTPIHARGPMPPVLAGVELAGTTFPPAANEPVHL